MAMVDALAAMPAKRRIVVAGEMLELGPRPRAASARRALYRRERRSMSCSECAAWRSHGGSSDEQQGMQAEFVATPEEAGEWLARETQDGDVVLLKASRGVKLEKASGKSGRTRSVRLLRERGTTIDRFGGRLLYWLLYPEAVSLLPAVPHFPLSHVPHRLCQPDGACSLA